jgi:hypothetical protein
MLVRVIRMVDPRCLGPRRCVTRYKGRSASPLAIIGSMSPPGGCGPARSGRGRGKRDWVEHDPDYDILRDDPRFKNLLARLK